VTKSVKAISILTQDAKPWPTSFNASGGLSAERGRHGHVSTLQNHAVEKGAAIRFNCQNHAVGKGAERYLHSASTVSSSAAPQSYFCEASDSNQYLIHLGSAGAALELTVEVEC
jgi:hypothetical protein